MSLPQAAALTHTSSSRRPPYRPLPSHTHTDAEESAELAAQAQEDAEWTAAADRSIGGGPAAVTRGNSGGGGFLGGGEGVVSSGEESHGDGVGVEWLGRDFWVGLESAHKKIQTARLQAE